MIAIIQYNAGNVQSVQNAISRLGFESIITQNPAEIRTADKIIFPGVGEAGTAMQHLKESGLNKLIPTLTQPFLGICLGLQLMCNHTEESDTECLGIFDTEVKRFPNNNIVPHMGWNTLKYLKGNLFNVSQLDSDVYFVHSYYATLCDATASVCQYGIPFSAALQKGNFYATQFHPEKSADIGSNILKNFLEL